MSSIEEVDFENYKLEAERSSQIRGVLERLKSQNWTEKLKQIARELGEVDKEADAADGKIPGLIKGQELLVYSPGAGHPAHGLQLTLSGNELKMRFEGVRLLELAFLPKDGEFLLLYLNEIQWEQLSKLMDDLQSAHQLAAAQKNERQAKWKKRFQKDDAS